jgi:hypothetical protein
MNHKKFPRVIYENFNKIKIGNVNPILIVPYQKSIYSYELENNFINHYSKLNNPIIIVEQYSGTYNSGALKNIGFDLTKKMNDILPENYLPKVYAFQDMKSLICDNLFKLYFSKLKTPIYFPLIKEKVFYGDIMIFDDKTFKKVNGFSNEILSSFNNIESLELSRNMITRLSNKNILITRPYFIEGDYRINNIQLEKMNIPYCNVLYNTKISNADNFEEDGLNSIQYNILDIHKYKNTNAFKVKVNLINKQVFKPLSVFPYSFSTFSFSF